MNNFGELGPEEAYNPFTGEMRDPLEVEDDHTLDAVGVDVIVPGPEDRDHEAEDEALFGPDGSEDIHSGMTTPQPNEDGQKNISVGDADAEHLPMVGGSTEKQKQGYDHGMPSGHHGKRHHGRKPKWKK